ncbi:MAG: ferritin-like domain-containing protein [Solirubrobacteraceae bacterium]
MAISSVGSLRQHLQWAIELEHATIPPYLCGLYSIKEGANPEAVEVIRSVFVEEMLHLTLVANILNAVGGSPLLDSPSMLPSFPACLPHSNRAFEVSLTKFSRDAVATFLRIERPAAHDGIPEDDEYETIGQFYEAIEEGLTRLTGELGQATVFSGDPARQISDELYYGGGGRIVVVSDLDSALAALTEIVDQGEGLQDQEIWDDDQSMFHPDREEVAHYFRFDELAMGRSYQRGDTPESGPSGLEFTVDWEAVHNMRPNPCSRDYPEGSEVRARMEEFNRSYSGVLHLLDRSFNGSPRLLAVAMGAMYGLKAQALALMALPSGDGSTTAGPSFEYVAPNQRRGQSDVARKIVVVADGPYLVYGDIPLVRKQKIVSEGGDSVSWKKTDVLATEENYALCRCGRSASKPFCDGSHARIGFDGAETADTRPSVERQRVLDGHGIVVKRDGPLCMHAAFCVGRLQKIPAMMPDTGDSDVRAQVIGMIDRCPSGSYTYTFETGAEDVEPDLPLAVAVTTEEDALAGALWITGGIPVERSDGQPFETRNRVTLCRCGHSKIKPLCDGTHREINFRE